MVFTLQYSLAQCRDGTKMVKEKYKIKLVIQPIYSIVIWLVVVLGCIALLIFPNLFWKDSDSLVWKIVYNVIFH